MSESDNTESTYLSSAELFSDGPDAHRRHATGVRIVWGSTRCQVALVTGICYVANEPTLLRSTSHECGDYMRLYECSHMRQAAHVDIQDN